MTKTEWLLKVVIPAREAVHEIEYGGIDISDLVAEIEKKGSLSVRERY